MLTYTKQARDALIVRLRRGGLTYQQIASEIGCCSVSTVRSTCRAAGLPSRLPLEPRSREALARRAAAVELTTARHAAGISRAELARRVGVSKVFLWMVENGRAGASQRTLDAWREALAW